MNIDSDKLLEWIGRYATAPDDGGWVTFKLDQLSDAIESGELTPKRVYARAPADCLPYKYITPAQHYAVTNDDGKKFEIEDDEGGICGCTWLRCHHLHGANWERVEK